MDKPMSPSFSKNQVKLAEELYKRGNLKGAIKIVKALIFGYPNTSAKHHEISQVLVAYQINWTSQQKSFTHYNILRISNPLCSHQMIQRKYRDIMVKLFPEGNISVATKTASMIINHAWEILSDPERRRDYNIKEGFDRRILVREPHQIVRPEKRQCVEIIDDSDSDSD